MNKHAAQKGHAIFFSTALADTDETRGGGVGEARRSSQARVLCEIGCSTVGSYVNQTLVQWDVLPTSLQTKSPQKDFFFAVYRIFKNTLFLLFFFYHYFFLGRIHAFFFVEWNFRCRKLSIYRWWRLNSFVFFMRLKVLLGYAYGLD